MKSTLCLLNEEKRPRNVCHFSCGYAARREAWLPLGYQTPFASRYAPRSVLDLLFKRRGRARTEGRAQIRKSQATASHASHRAAKPFGVLLKMTAAKQKSTQLLREGIALLLLLVLFTQSSPLVHACGPETVDPIFVFKNSPDPPFEDFAKGKIGVLQPTFGRKTLVIAHRYLEGGTFSEDEQRELVEALKGKAPEEDNDTAIKAWIAARKEVIGEEKETLSIYDQRRNGSFDFFPNCTKNAFEVATQTLKDRVATYGATDQNVRNWLKAQDVVFKNCAEGAESPGMVAAGSPRWLQKDRDYQIAAAFFYSLNFRDARARFQAISEDVDSVWQETAGYLVARTLVREASLSSDEKAKKTLYERAESTLLTLIARGGKFQIASQRLLGLVKYRLRPEERVKELSRVLNEQSGNGDLRQDLIDYVWLLDKFDEQARKAEEQRKKLLEPTPSPTPEETPNREYQERYEAVQRGELIEIYFTPLDDKDQFDYKNAVSLYLKSDVKEADVFSQVEVKLGRKLSAKEAVALKERYESAVSRRQWLLSPNRKMDTGSQYDGCYSACNELRLASFPNFLRNDELSDWILTLQSADPQAYPHSVARWRDTHSQAWLAVALSKAPKTSRTLPRLIAEAERVNDDAPVYPTVAYHLIRLLMELNRTAEARKLLAHILATRLESLPHSSQNLFLKQRFKMAGSVAEFLRFAGRQPAAFYNIDSFGRMIDLMNKGKSSWDPQYDQESKEDYERSVEEKFKDLLPWDDRKVFDEETTDILNWHFPLTLMLATSRDSELPDYLRQSIALSVWTRAVLLDNEAVARQVSADLAQRIPEMSGPLEEYLAAKTPTQRDDEALYIMLKFPSLTPWVRAGIPEFSTTEKSEYYFELSWWCRPDETEFQNDGTEVKKQVPIPRFLSPKDLLTAKRERTELMDIGDAKSYLGELVLDWAKRSPSDPRIPEALYIGAKANQSYKYGCGGWERDEEVRNALEKLLREKYPRSEWTAKLNEEPRQ